MLSNIAITRETGNGRHGDVLDVAEHLGLGVCGSAVNAIAVMVRQSPLFQETLPKVVKVDSVPVRDAQS